QLIPKFIEQDKRRLVVAFGCTGGRHRSVCAAEELNRRMKDRYHTTITHRDLVTEGGDIKERIGERS
ncbi:MAG: RNase adaptor protein RapZ, partial [Clostridia bacterium]|nr:RNase adaptor protein RapZ [Clostridia bacterium]